jgi:hypothetical protein
MLNGWSKNEIKIAECVFYFNLLTLSEVKKVALLHTCCNICRLQTPTFTTAISLPPTELSVNVSTFQKLFQNGTMLRCVLFICFFRILHLLQYTMHLRILKVGI